MTEIVKQSQTVRGGRFESSFLTWPGEPNTHAWGSSSRFAHVTFSFSFQSVDPGHSPRLQSTATLQPHVALILDQVQKRVQGRSTRWSNLVLMLTNYHISRHVASTFKSLTKCATHRDLNSFSTTQTGNHKYTSLPLVLIFLQNVKAFQLL